MIHLTRLSLANRLIVGLITLAIMGFGIWSALDLKQELLPSITPPQAVVTATYPGVSPQIIARDVATPIERALTGVSGVTTVSSRSVNSNAVISVEWDYGLDTETVLSNIRTAVDGLQSLPTDVSTDVISGGTDDIPVLLLAVSSDAGLDATARLVDDVAIPDLSAVEGVRQVGVTGGNDQQVSITLRPNDLADHDLTAATVTQIVQAQTSVVPAGSSYSGTKELAVEVGAAPDSVTAVKSIEIPTADGPVKLSKLADVAVTEVESTTLARSNSRPAVSLSVVKKADADAVRVSHDVAALVPSLQDKIGNNARFTTVFDQAPLIEQSIHDLTTEGLLGLGFAVVVILVFLLSVRSTLITAISIPLSLLIAMIGLRAGNLSLNIFTLAALTVAVGRVVDDSIVVLENIKRRAVDPQALTPTGIVASVREVAGAVTASTLTTVAVFLPVTVVSGVVGELFKPFAITVTIALAASLLVALTIVPVLAYWFLRRRSSPAVTAPARSVETAPGLTAETAEQTKVTRLQRGYLPVLRAALRHPVITLAVAALVFVATLGSTTLLKTDFLGSVSDQSTLSITQELPAGTKLATTSAAAQQVEKVLAADPRIANYLTTIGSSLIPGTGSGTSLVDFYLTLAPGARADAVRPDLQTRLDALRGVGDLTVSNANNSATTTDLTVTVEGDNAANLRTGAETVVRKLQQTAGLSEVTSDLAEQRDVLKVVLDPTKAAKLGFTQAEVGQAVANALRGTKVGNITLSGEQRDIYVYPQSASDPDPSDIADLLLPVSQLQQAKAQQKAADNLADDQQKLTDEQTARAQQAADKQTAALRDQRDKLADSLASNEKQAAKTAKQIRQAKQKLAGQQRALAALQRQGPPPGPGPVTPTSAPLPAQVYQAAQAQQQYQQQLAGAQAAVAQSQATVSQLQAGAKQADQGVTQTRKSLSDLDDQLADAADQQAQNDEQRKQSEALAKRQQNLSDVRADAIQVKDIATVMTQRAPTTVNQVKGTPSVTVTATPTAADLGALTTQLRAELAATPMPAGITATLGGASEDQQNAFRQLGLAMLVALAAVFLIMVGTFRSLVQPLILMVSVPFAATGAILGLLITDIPLGVPAMVGLLMLIGIVVTNAIVLIDLINQYRRRGEPLADAVVDGARLRLRPIVMTAAATICALIPMGLGLTGGGAFVSRPLAVVVIGGLVSSTVLTLILVPVLYSLAERRGERRRLRNAAAAGEGQVA